MKCRSLVITGWKTSRAKKDGKPEKILGSISRTRLYEILEERVIESNFTSGYFKELLRKIRLDSPLVNGFYFCDGNIICNIVQGYESYHGGYSSHIEVEYKCDRCGHTDFPELPQTEVAVSELVTKVIAEMR